MAPAAWSPNTYLRYRDERARPFRELLARVPSAPKRIVDLGCGPGHLSAALLDRWPESRVLGIDSSAEMVAAAERQPPDSRVAYRLAELRACRPERPVDLLVSNATLQWVPNHLSVLPQLAEMVAGGGTLAFSVPANFAEPSHVLLRELAAAEPYAAVTRGVEWPDAYDAGTYLDVLARPGWSVDAWATEYLHVLTGPDPVFAWIAGTGARPVLQALPTALREEFVATYKQRLSEAYPARSYGTVLSFRRVFVVACRVGEA